MLALVDCNNFFASCEEVFDPSLRNKPLIILSNNDGCAIARSQKAKEMGVKMGDPPHLFSHRKDLQVRSSNFSLYGDMSDRVMQTLLTFTPDVEVYSIDEAFLKLNCKAEEIRQKVKKWTGIPVSIGVAPTKTLAKLAAGLAKKKSSGVHIFQESDLVDTPVEEVWGIGRRFASTLKKNRIYSALDLKNLDRKKAEKLLTVVGLRTVMELSGEEALFLKDTQEPRKSIVCSESFGENITTLEKLSESISYHLARALVKLRKEKKVAGFLSVFVMTDSREMESRKTVIANPTSYTPFMTQVAKKLLVSMYNEGKTYKKAGVMLCDFYPEGERPLDLFEKPLSLKEQEISTIMDEINRKYKKEALSFASSGTERNWRAKSNLSSPKYTTSWKELLEVC